MAQAITRGLSPLLPGRGLKPNQGRKQGVLRHSHSPFPHRAGWKGPTQRPLALSPARPQPATFSGRVRGAAGRLLRNLGTPSLLHKLLVAGSMCAVEEDWDFLPTEHFLHLVLFALFGDCLRNLSLQDCTLFAAEWGPPQSSGEHPHHGPHLLTP